jgi:hypothetical protein
VESASRLTFLLRLVTSPHVGSLQEVEKQVWWLMSYAPVQSIGYFLQVIVSRGISNSFTSDILASDLQEAISYQSYIDRVIGK